MAGKNKIKPLFDNVLIKPLEAEEKTPSGLFFRTLQRKPQIGEVMAVGPGSTTDDGKLIPMTVKIGQKVMYKNGAEAR